jgi:hypothetical protein
VVDIALDVLGVQSAEEVATAVSARGQARCGCKCRNALQSAVNGVGHFAVLGLEQGGRGHSRVA